MFKKLTLAAAAGAGYVLGAKAGKERYAQIESKFREVAGMPAVQDATSTVKETASSFTDTAKQTVNEKVEGASGSSGKHGSDKGSSGMGATGGASGGSPSTTGVDEDVVVGLGTGANTGAAGSPGSTGSTSRSDTV